MFCLARYAGNESMVNSVIGSAVSLVGLVGVMNQKFVLKDPLE